jgi:hypothetical protein
MNLPTINSYAMLPTFMTKRTAHQRPDPAADRVERVVLARLTDDLRPFWFMVGTIEGTVGDEVLVRFGEVVVQVPAEMLVGAGE